MIGLLRRRLELIMSCLGLAVIAFWTAPGNLISDTKLDFSVSPLGFLMRSAELWDTQFLGQLQNQAAGYFFPMGPFFALGDLIGLPPWITQRLWITVLLSAGFIGAVKVAERFGIGTPTTRVAGGLAFVLTPRVLSIAGQISSEWEATAFLPWILLPLIGATKGGRLRAALVSAIAVSLCGGVNAAAVLAALAVPALYLLYRRDWQLIAWWVPLAALATVWWTVPLVLLGRFGFSFLPYTETSAVTTLVTSVPNTLIGNSDWVSYVEPGTAGFALANEPLYVLAAALVAALGLVGAVRRDLPQRGFLLLCLVAGIVIIAAGHVSVIEAPFAPWVRDLIDGPLAPLRNLRKFDAMVRLPLTLGLAHVLAQRLPQARTIAVVALTGVVFPALTTGIARPGDFPAVPDYWRQAATWLNANTGDSAVLGAPGADFGEFTWGRPMDNPMQSLLDVRWVSRELTPYGSAGLVRLLDAVEERLTTGRPSRGMAEVLGRMGIRYVLARNDLDRSKLRGAWPSRVRTALAGSPGISKVKAFGPVVGDARNDDAETSIDQPIPALEVYEVADAADRVEMYSAGEAVGLSGAPDGLLDLADEGVLADRPVMVGAGRTGTPVAGDSFRLRKRSFGGIRRSGSPTVTDTGDAYDIAAPEWRPTLADHLGVAGLSASSSASDASEYEADPGHLPYAAFDRDPGTSWKAGGRDRDPWLGVDLAGEREISQITVRLPENAAPDRVVVETAAGDLPQKVAASGTPQRLQVPEGRTRWLRIKGLPAVAELEVPGVTVHRTLRVPGEGEMYVMSRRGGEAAPCMAGTGRWVCNGLLAARGEEGNAFDRTITVGDDPVKRKISGQAVLRQAALIERYMRLGPVKVEGSSIRVDHPAALPSAAFDADSRTTWIPAASDGQPTLRISWKRARKIDEIRIVRPGGSRPDADVLIQGDRNKVRGGEIARDGTVSFKPMKTKSLKLRFNGQVQISEITVPGVSPGVGADTERLELKCGYGPQIQVNGAEVPTKASGTFGDLRAGRPLRYTACEEVPLASGVNRFHAPPEGAYRIESLVVGELPSAARTAASGRVTGWSRDARSVEVEAAQAAYLAVTENFNTGWRATIGGTELRPVKIDGWRQGWEVPAGTSGIVRMVFEPALPYRVGVFGGLAVLAILIALAAVLSHRARRASRSEPDRRPRGEDEPGPERLRGAGRDVCRGKRLRELHWVAGLAGSALLGVWLAGLPGLAVAIPGFLTLAWGRRHRASGDAGPVVRLVASSWLPGGLLTLAALSTVAGRALRANDAGASLVDAVLDVSPQLLGVLIVVGIMAHASRVTGSVSPAK